MQKQVKLFAPYGLLVFSILVLWCGVYGKTSLSAWGAPPVYTGDSLLGYSLVKAASDGGSHWGGVLEAERLNAPFGGHWKGWPVVQDFWTASLGKLALGLGLFEGINLFLVFSAVLSGCAFFYAARQTQASTPLGLMGALLFAFCPFVEQQLSSGTLPLVVTWPLPLMVLAFYWLNRHEFLVDEGWRIGCLLGLSVIVGAGQPVYSLIYVQLLGFTVLANGFTGYRRKATVGVVMILVLVSVFGLVHFASLLNSFNQLVISPNSLGLDLVQGLQLANLFTPDQPGYLGLIGVFSLCWLVFEAAFIMLSKKPKQLSGFAGIALWIFTYAVTGGVGSLLKQAGLPVFGLTDRYSGLLLAVLLLALIARLSALLNRKQNWAFAGVLFLIGGAEQFFLVSQNTANLAQQDRSFARSLEQHFEPGTALFQLPVGPVKTQATRFGAVTKMEAFDPLRPYLFTKNLKFSFGGGYSQGDQKWQKNAENQRPLKMIKQLQAYGFKGLIINWRAYPDFAHKLAFDLSKLGYKQLPTSVANRSLIAFDISKEPVIPPAQGHPQP